MANGTSHQYAGNQYIYWRVVVTESSTASTSTYRYVNVSIQAMKSSASTESTSRQGYMSFTANGTTYRYPDSDTTSITLSANNTWVTFKSVSDIAIPVTTTSLTVNSEFKLSDVNSATTATDTFTLSDLVAYTLNVNVSEGAHLALQYAGGDVFMAGTNGPYIGTFLVAPGTTVIFWHATASDNYVLTQARVGDIDLTSNGQGLEITSDVDVIITAAPISYTITYNPNTGGTGAPANQTKTYGETLTLSTTIPTKNSSTSAGYKVIFNGNGGTASPTSVTATNTTTYTFSEWNTTADGTGTSYNSGGSYTANADVTLYAQYTPSVKRGSVTCATATRADTINTFTTIINANGGSSTITSYSTSTTTSYTCDGWYTASVGGTKRGDLGASYTPNSTETLYAVWTPAYGSIDNIILPTAEQCTREGYTLQGFAISNTATTATYEPGAEYTPAGSTTLHAIWRSECDEIYIYSDGTIEAIDFVEVDTVTGHFARGGIVYATNFITHDLNEVHIASDGTIYAKAFNRR